MKNLLISFITLLTSVSMYALPIGNPWEASLLCDGVFCEGTCGIDLCDPCVTWYDAWSVRVGFYGDYVYNHHMEVDSNIFQGTIRSTEIYTNAAYLALNFFNRVDIFTTLGKTKLFIMTPGRTFGDNRFNLNTFLDTESYFSWSLGGRGTLWECGCLGVGLEAQYFQTRPNMNSFRVSGEDTVYFRNGDRLKYREWQVGLGAAYRINITYCSTALVPYVGVKFNHAEIDMDELMLKTDGTTYTFRDIESERDWGWAVGLTLVGCNKISVTVEGRYANEKAVYVNSQLHF